MTANDIKAALAMLQAVADTIREAGCIPSGTLYAALMGKVDLAGYNRLIDTLKRADVIKEVNHELIWIAPAPAGKAAL